MHIKLGVSYLLNVCRICLNYKSHPKKVIILGYYQPGNFRYIYLGQPDKLVQTEHSLYFVNESFFSSTQVLAKIPSFLEQVIGEAFEIKLTVNVCNLGVFSTEFYLATSFKFD